MWASGSPTGLAHPDPHRGGQDVGSVGSEGRGTLSLQHDNFLSPCHGPSQPTGVTLALSCLPVSSPSFPSGVRRPGCLRVQFECMAGFAGRSCWDGVAHSLGQVGPVRTVTTIPSNKCFCEPRAELTISGKSLSGNTASRVKGLVIPLVGRGTAGEALRQWQN